MIYNSVLPYSIKENLLAFKGLRSNEKQILKFESMLSEYTGKHAVALYSGLSAIRIFLKLRGLSEGDEIAVPAYLCDRVGIGLLADGYRLNFIDVDNNYNISPDDLAKKISMQTKALVAVHSYGISCNMPAVKEIADQYRIVVVEDSAQSFGGRIGNHLLGTLGDVGVYSFGWFKPMTAMGGGALVSGNKEVVEGVKRLAVASRDNKDKVVKLFKSMLYVNKGLYFATVVKAYNKISKFQNHRAHAEREKQKNTGMACNFNRIQNIQAGIGIAQFEKIKMFNSKRIANTRKIMKGLSYSPLKFPPDSLSYPMLRLPVLFADYSYDKLVKASRSFYEENVDAPILYPFLPEVLGLDADCPKAKFLSEHTLHLPVHPCLKEPDLDRIVSVTKKIFAKV